MKNVNCNYIQKNWFAFNVAFKQQYLNIAQFSAQTWSKARYLKNHSLATVSVLLFTCITFIKLILISSDSSSYSRIFYCTKTFEQIPEIHVISAYLNIDVNNFNSESNILSRLSVLSWRDDSVSVGWLTISFSLTIWFLWVCIPWQNSNKKYSDSFMAIVWHLK